MDQDEVEINVIKTQGHEFALITQPGQEIESGRCHRCGKTIVQTGGYGGFMNECEGRSVDAP